MKKSFSGVSVFLFLAISIACFGAKKEPVPGAARIELYKPLIEGKSVAVVANQTSMVGTTHLVDNLLGIGMNIKVDICSGTWFQGAGRCRPENRRREGPRHGNSADQPLWRSSETDTR